MKKLEFHPYCTLFPACTEEELQALTEDIRQNGLLDHIVLFEGKILDGRNRYTGCLRSKTEVQTAEYDGDDPLGFVLSKNLHRRHLSESQRAMVAAKLANMPLGSNQYGRSANLQTLPKHLNNQHETKNCEQRERTANVSQSDAAKQLKVSTRSVANATKLRKEAPAEIIEQVERGEKTVHAALREIQPEKSKGSGVRGKDEKSKSSSPPRRKTVAKEPVEPEEQGEFIKIPLPIDHATSYYALLAHFQDESQEIRRKVIDEIIVLSFTIGNLDESYEPPALQ